MEARSQRNLAVGIIVGLFALVAGCGSKDQFTRGAISDFFVQDYNPEVIDVLWVVDNRSPMYRVRDRLAKEAKEFFTRLDGTASKDYRMAIVSSDMLVAKGRIQPVDAPQILTKNKGSLEERVNLFGSLLTQVINLKTDAETKGFEAADVALTNYFKPRAGVPLVMVFISDSDEASDVNGVTDVVKYYSDKFIALMGGKNRIRVYSINYKALPAGADATLPQYDSNRCATRYNADIDSDPRPGWKFEDRYFGLEKAIGGDIGDLCGEFAQTISLDGLRLKELQYRFVLSKKPKVDSISISLFRNKEKVEGPAWTFNVDTNEVVFAQTPPEGVTIQVTFQTP